MFHGRSRARNTFHGRRSRKREEEEGDLQLKKTCDRNVGMCLHYSLVSESTTNTENKT
jgi:hypothetical protein